MAATAVAAVEVFDIVESFQLVAAAEHHLVLVSRKEELLMKATYHLKHLNH